MSPALAVLVFMVLSSCATLAVPSASAPPSATSAQTADAGSSSRSPSPAAPTLPTPAATAGRPSVDLLARPTPVPPAPLPEVSFLDLPTPVLPTMLSLPLIPQPQIAADAQSASGEAAPSLGPVLVVSPQAPAQSATKTAAAAPGGTPAVTASPPAGAASAPSPPQPAKPSAAAPRTAAPVSPSSPTAGSASRSGQGSATAGSRRAPKGKSAPRIVYAKVGDDITIALDGQGWTFTGGASGGERWKTGVQYESRSSDSSGTTFIFKAKALGTWSLGFQQQNAASGASTQKAFDVHVLTSAEFDRTIAAKGSGGASGQAGAPSSAGPSSGAAANGQLAAAEWLYKEGKYTEALTAYEKAWQPDDPALTEKIAELAYRVGRYAEARTYWQKNFGLTGTQYGNLAVAGLMKTATAQKNAPELRALFDYVHSLTGVSFREDLLNAGRFLYREKDWNVAVRYLDEYLKRYNGHEGADAADYLLGEIYSGPTPMQDAKKAMGYFRRIVTDYPTSGYYEQAKSSIVYLNRQFFEIR